MGTIVGDSAEDFKVSSPYAYHASYYCLGDVGDGAVGYGRCLSVQESSETFSTKAVLTASGYVFDIAKRLKIC